MAKLAITKTIPLLPVAQTEESPFCLARSNATQAMHHGRLAAQYAILCGLELIRLQEQYGTAPGRRTDLATLSTSPQRAERLNWPELVQREVGISDDTARRWMAAARAQLPALSGRLLQLPRVDPEYGEDTPEATIVRCIADAVDPRELHAAVATLAEGKTLEQLLLPLDQAGAFDPTRLVGKERSAYEKVRVLSEPWDAVVADTVGFSREEYEKLHEDAIVIRKRVEAAETPPSRAWGALLGRNSTKEGRAPTDHRVNIETAILKLNNSLAHWDSLDAEDRAHIETMWQELWQVRLPGSWKGTGKKLEGWK